MFKLDDNLLRELGLGALPPAEKNRMLSHIYETLEMRVGMKLAQQMTNEQLDEFEAYIDRKDEAGALKWLETNFPNYKQVVADELERLKGEIKTAAPQILAAAAQQPLAPAPLAQAQPQAPAPQQPYAQPQPAMQPYAQPQPQPAMQPYAQAQPQPQYPAPVAPVPPMPPAQPYAQPQPMQPPHPDPAQQYPPQQYPPQAA